MAVKKPKPKQLRPFTLVVVLIELGLALWAFTVMRRYWLAADGPLPGPFWGAAALVGFSIGLVLANSIGVLQTLGNLNRRRPVGSRLPVRLSAVEDPHQEITVGLIPLILAFGLPVYPLLKLAWLNWLDDLQLVWLGLALIGALVTLFCLYIIGRQVYLLLIGSKTGIEVSHEVIHPGQTLQVVLTHRPGRLPTQAVEAKLVCRQTAKQKMKDQGYRYVTTVLNEETLGTYHQGDIPLLALGSPPITTTIPPDAHVSTDPDDYPTIEWRIEVGIKVDRLPDFGLIFPFKVTEKV